MIWRITVVATARRVRVDVHLGDRRLSAEDDSLVALQYNAAKRTPAIVAVGADVRAIPDKLRALDRSTAAARDAKTRVVDADRVTWWRPIRARDVGRPRDEDLDPERHDAEVVAIDPFAESTFHPAALVGVVAFLVMKALGPRAWRLFVGPREIDLRLPFVPSDTEGRHQLWLAIRDRYPRCHLDGVPFDRPVPRTWREWPLRIVAMYAAVIAFLFVRFAVMLPRPRVAWAMSAVILVAAASECWSFVRRT